MTIIVEGPNNVGKSTFINMFLSEHPQFIVEHCDETTPNDYNFYHHLITQDNVIYDRSFISERVYSKLYDRTPKLSSDEFVKLCNCNKSNILYIFIDADYNFMVRACKNKNEEFDFDTSAKERELFNHYRHILRDYSPVYLIHNHIHEYDDCLGARDVLDVIDAIVEDK